MTKRKSLHKNQPCCRVCFVSYYSRTISLRTPSTASSACTTSSGEDILCLGVPFLTTGDAKATDTYTDTASSNSRRCRRVHRRGNTVLTGHRSGCWGGRTGSPQRPPHREEGAPCPSLPRSAEEAPGQGPGSDGRAGSCPGESGRAAVPLQTWDRTLPARARHPRRRR